MRRLRGWPIGPKTREVHRAAREPAIIKRGRHQPPAFVALASNRGVARFALRIEPIKLQLEALFGLLTGVRVKQKLLVY